MLALCLASLALAAAPAPRVRHTGTFVAGASFERFTIRQTGAETFELARPSTCRAISAARAPSIRRRASTPRSSSIARMAASSGSSARAARSRFPCSS
jgi:hypothetical protein